MKLTVGDIVASKGRGQLTELNVACVQQAAAAEAAGIEIIVSGRRHLREALRAAAPNTHFTCGLIYGQTVNADEAKRAAFEAMEGRSRQHILPHALRRDRGDGKGGDSGRGPYRVHAAEGALDRSCRARQDRAGCTRHS